MDTVTGYVDHIIYQNKENGYAVISLAVEGEELVCVGTLHSVEAGAAGQLCGASLIRRAVKGGAL